VDFRVVITLDQSYPGLRPGLSATAEITAAHRDSALAIPIQALTLRTKKALEDDQRRFAPQLDKAGADDGAIEFPDDSNEREGIFLVESGHAVFRPVETGIAGDRYFEVLSGLEGGERVISGPMRAVRTLHHGERVKVSSEVEDETDDGGGGVRVEVDTDE
jgi:HlyD family secretion protein